MAVSVRRLVVIAAGAPSGDLPELDALLIALTMAWWRVRQRDIAGHREWMLRAIAVMLGIATTRPVMAVFFATSPVTGLTPAHFFGYAFWIGFTITVVAAELYIRATKN